MNDPKQTGSQDRGNAPAHVSLSLQRESLRELSAAELESIWGGAPSLWFHNPNRTPLEG